MQTSIQNFINYLEGLLSSNPKKLNKEQTAKLKAKLASVFNKVTPDLNIKDSPIVSSASNNQIPILGSIGGIEYSQAGYAYQGTDCSTDKKCL